MIYLLTGDDGEKARAKAHEIIDSLVAKKPDAELFKLDADAWTQSEMEQFMGGSGLFERNFIVFLDHTFSNDEAKDFFLKSLKDIEESKNVFIVLEDKLLKADKDRIEKKASKVQEFLKKEIGSKREFNMFALTDALGKRDKKELWVLYNKAVFAEKAPEEIHGLLFWQVKSMLQAQHSKSANEAGQKPFVYSKSLSYTRNFKPNELEKKSAELVSLYHDARRGIVEFDVGLERWILGL